VEQISRVSRFFRVLFQAVFISIVVLNVIAWPQAPEPLTFFTEGSGVIFSVIPSNIPILHPLTTIQKVYGFLISLVPLLIHLFTIYYLIVLFGLYEKGKIFFLENVRAIRRIGILLVAKQLVYPLYLAVMTPMLSWHNPVGERVISTGFSGSNVGLLVVGVIIILVSWVMAEGCKLQEEHDLTV
jgi:hypothetical protein